MLRVALFLYPHDSNANQIDIPAISLPLRSRRCPNIKNNINDSIVKVRDEPKFIGGLRSTFERLEID